jgi:hypothetical protein
MNAREAAPALITAATDWVLMALTTRAFSEAADQTDPFERSGAQVFLTHFQKAISQTGGNKWLNNKQEAFDCCMHKTRHEAMRLGGLAASVWFSLFFLNIIPAPHQSFTGEPLAQIFSDALVFLVPLILVTGAFYIFRFSHLCHQQQIPQRWFQPEQNWRLDTSPFHRTLTEVDELGRLHSNPASGLPLTHGGGMDMGGNPNGSSR